MKKVLAVIIVLTLCVCMFGCGKPDEATQIVIDEIAELEASDHITLDGIAKAKERYNSLSDKQKEKVTNYATLLKMEDNYEELGKITLNADNWPEFLDVKGRCFGSDGDSKKNPIPGYGKTDYSHMTVETTVKGKENHRYENVMVSVEISVNYIPYLMKPEMGFYAFYDGTPAETEEWMRVISCDESGNGFTTDVKECKTGAFSNQSLQDFEIIITDVSGTVLPME